MVWLLQLTRLNRIGVMEVNVSRIKVPRVDLLDINREPTDDELEALMQAMVDSANEKWRVTKDKYMGELFEAMKVAAKEGAEWAKEIQSQKQSS